VAETAAEGARLSCTATARQQKSTARTMTLLLIISPSPPSHSSPAVGVASDPRATSGTQWRRDIVPTQQSNATQSEWEARTLRVAARRREALVGRAGGPGGHEVAIPVLTGHRRLVVRQQRAATIERRAVYAPREARTPGCGVAAGSALCQCLEGGTIGTVARAHPRVGQDGSRRHRRVATPARHVVRRRRRRQRWRRRRQHPCRSHNSHLMRQPDAWHGKVSNVAATDIRSGLIALYQVGTHRKSRSHSS
jgi:hypothetical protein